MTKFVKEIIINATPDEVFAYVADLPKHPDWASHNLEVTQTSSDADGAGSTFTSTGHQMGTHQDNLTVSEYAPGKRFAFESIGDAGTTSHAFDVAAVDGGTRLTKSFEIVRPSMMTRLAMPVLMLAGPKGLTADLTKIKNRLES